MQSIRSAIRGLQRWIADLNEKKQLLLDALEKAKKRLDANVNFELTMELLLLEMKENG